MIGRRSAGTWLAALLGLLGPVGPLGITAAGGAAEPALRDSPGHPPGLACCLAPRPTRFPLAEPYRQTPGSATGELTLECGPGSKLVA